MANYKATRKIRKKHNFAKLNSIDVIMIKQILRQRGRPTFKRIGERFNVSHSTISRIANNKIWKHIVIAN